jgi:hypothetical protein
MGSSPRRQDDPGDWSTRQWSAWRDRRIRDILESTVVVQGRRVLSRPGVIQQCTLSYLFLEPFMSDPAFTGDGGKAKALEHFFSFVRTQSTMGHVDSRGIPDHALGFGESDLDYWRRVSGFFALPPLLTSQRFLRAMESPRDYHSAMNMIADYNSSIKAGDRWVAIPYRSRFLKSPDKATYGRLFLFVPGPNDGPGRGIDLWIQFAIETPGEPGPKPRSVSVVAVRHGDPDEAALSDFMRVPDSSGQISLVPTVQLDDNPSKNCYECHKSAVLPIHPAKFIDIGWGKNVTDLERETELVNRRAESLRNLMPIGADAQSYGPTLGEGVSKSPTSLQAINPGLSKSSVRRVVEAMTCASCHEAGTVRVNYPAAILTDSLMKTFEGGSGLAQTYVERGWMPPGSSLDTKERAALWRALDASYLDLSAQAGAFVDWLRGMDFLPD